MERRSFLGTLGASIGMFAVGNFLPLARAATPAPSDLPILPEKDKMAVQLEYCSNGKKPSDLCKTRKDPTRKDQFCGGCQLYTKVKGEGDNEVGKCLLFAKNVVPKNAWCKSWVKRPG